MQQQQQHSTDPKVGIASRMRRTRSESECDVTFAPLSIPTNRLSSATHSCLSGTAGWIDLTLRTYNNGRALMVGGN